MCLLGKEIGFDVDANRRQYVMSKSLYTVAVQEPPPVNLHTIDAPTPRPGVQLMTSIAIQDRTNPMTLQLLSSGDTPLLLYNCKEFWDGRTLQPLTDITRNRIFEIYQQWTHRDLRCVAFAYTPIPTEHAPFYLDPSRFFFLSYRSYDCVIDCMVVNRSHR